MKYFIPLLLILLTACDMGTPLPTRCREVGVAVTDKDTITGEIIEEHSAPLDAVRARCQDTLTKEKYGCTVAVNVNEFVLWYVDDPNIRDHERCHALYEEWDHG